MGEPKHRTQLLKATDIASHCGQSVHEAKDETLWIGSSVKMDSWVT